METGADYGMWTFTRYRSWMANRRDWYVPAAHAKDLSIVDEVPRAKDVPTATARGVTKAVKSSPSSKANPSGRIEIEPDDGGLETILKKLT